MVFISSEGEAFSRMMNRSSFSRAQVVEFQEVSDDEAYEFLRIHLGADKFNAMKNELVDLVSNYTGGHFTTLYDVAQAVDLQGILMLCFISFLTLIGNHLYLSTSWFRKEK
jgi:hypothetical protein